MQLSGKFDLFPTTPMLLGQHAGDLVVTVGFSQRIDALLLWIEQVELAAEVVNGNVVLLQLGVHRENDIGQQRIVWWCAPVRRRWEPPTRGSS